MAIDRYSYPFTAIVGQEQMKLALVLNAINPSEDRVVGTIDLEAALKEGSRRFEPGVLAEANRNILYVDEVNLLDDHIVDVLLDAAAMGVNVVEREGVSFAHPSRFILVGTMNPEEGELRPQLLDRFGLCVDIEGIRDPDQRVLISERDAAFKKGDHEFATEFAAADHNLSRALAEAIVAVKNVRITTGQTRLISSICVEADVLGHRADVVIDHAARALAAYRRHESPSRDDIYDAATLALAHRARQPLRRDQEETTSPEQGDEQEGSNQPESDAGEPTTSAADSGQQSSGSDQGMTTGGSSGSESAPEATDMFNLERIDLPRQ